MHVNNVQLRMQRVWKGGFSGGDDPLSGGSRNFRGPQPVCLFGHHAKFVFLPFIFCFQFTFIKRITKLVTLAS